MDQQSAAIVSGAREVIGAWLVCLGVAAGCFGLLAVSAPGRGTYPEALISPDPIATVAAAEIHRQGRC